MDKKVYDLLKIIFGDASLIDVDFSTWDKNVSILVVSDHLESTISPERRAIFKIEFVNATSIQIEFKHYSNYLYKNDTSLHNNWPIDRSEIKLISDKSCEITFWQSGDHPVFKVVCESVNLTEFPHVFLDTISPDWFKPFSPLARRDVESIYNVFILSSKGK